NSRDLRAEYGSSDFDNRHRISVSAVYEFPFGRDNRFFSKGIVAAVASGWQLSTILSAYSARHFNLYYSSDVSNTLNLHDRPNITSDLNAGTKTPSQWFNATAISTPATGTFGDEGRNAVLGPGYAGLDATLSRDFALPKKDVLKFRAEF